MAFLDEVGEELQEESDDEQADVHAVNIGIGSHYHLIITKRVETVLYVESCLQKIELLVLVDHLLGEAEGVEGFSAKREHGLCVHVATFGDASTGGVALGDEDAGFLLALVLDIGVMDAAVAQLAVMQVGLLGALAGQLGHSCHSLPFALAGGNLLEHRIGNIRILMQEVIHFLLDEVAHVFVYRNPARAHGERTELNLGLALEHGLLDVDGDGGHDAVTDVAILEVLAIEFLDGLGDMLLEGTLVGAALGGMLSVHERVVFLAVLIGVGEGNLDILALDVDDWIDGVGGHRVGEQVLQTIARKDASPIVHDGQACVQVGIVAQHGLHELIMELVVLKKGVVGFEENIGAALVLSRLGGVAHQLTALKFCRAHLAVAIGSHLEMRTEEVDGLDANTVHAHRLLEGLGIIFASGVELADGLDHLLLRDAAPIVTKRHAQIIFDVDFNALAFVHAELVDGIVDSFLEEHVDTVLRLRPVAQTADIHAGTGADVFDIGQVADAGGVVVDRPTPDHCHLFFFYIFFCHILVSGCNFQHRETEVQRIIIPL